ncbi:putative 50S ribosomal subunit protein L35 [Candidatus Tremblaya princeps PCIT]|uniref:50S ribosomal protein L35 n=1 Tax=Tremblaya princeps (strain PCIT) TaxID=891398 RepID=F7XYF7_TREPP|nr:putative 50S ribosomal subunit protein L35 [Candidatus Tremblaya princeps PCIT]AEK38416.1 50S ribosomal protein L35 [Candidatus Tremblaya princeps PCVAL]
MRSSISKRLRLRPSGSIKRGSAGRRHLMTGKPMRRKRRLRGANNVHDNDLARIRRAMCA